MYICTHTVHKYNYVYLYIYIHVYMYMYIHTSNNLLLPHTEFIDTMEVRVDQSLAFSTPQLM